MSDESFINLPHKTHPETMPQTFATPSKPRRNAISILKSALGYVIPLALTVSLVWYMFEKVNFSEVMRIIRTDVDDFWWILVAMGISVFSHIFRAMRWRLQLRALGIRPPLMALTCSIFGTYALNLVFPRLGEVWRCTYIAGRQKAQFTTVFGSMVADRLADTVTVLLLTILAFVVATPAINAFLDKYPVGQDAVRMASDPYFWAVCVIAVIVVVALFRLFRNTRFGQKISSGLRHLWEGFAVIARMPGRGRFCLLTLCIWGCYFMQLYVAFYAFTFTAALCGEPGLAFGLIPCLVAFVLSSIGMAIPSNGGLGPWNIAVMFGLAVFGISEGQGTAFSVLVWSAQTVMLILLGIYTMIYISADRRKAHA